MIICYISFIIMKMLLLMSLDSIFWEFQVHSIFPKIRR